MKLVLSVCVAFFLGGCSTNFSKIFGGGKKNKAIQEQTLFLSKEIYKIGHLPFKSHAGSGRWDNYLIVDLPYLPIADLKASLEKQLGAELIGRDEAHITVITPPEYWQILNKRISINEINSIALSYGIQNISYDVKCLGRAQAKILDKTESTYFVVISSKDISKLRKEIQHLYISRGGRPKLFDPDNFDPHITVGFTKRDLHKSDGVSKGLASCFRNIEIAANIESLDQQKPQKIN